MNTSDNSNPKILIVGSGPSGLVLALSLRRNGIPVRVIEKCMENRIGQRGAGIMPRSLELFEALGVYEDVRSRAMRGIPLLRMYKMPEGVEVLKEFSMAPWEDPTPSIPYNNLVFLGQDSIDKILRAQLSKFGCEVELGLELTSFEQSDTEVNVSLLNHNLKAKGENGEAIVEKASYDWVIGADGAKGAVRRVLGLKLLGETNPERFVIGDVEIEGLECDIWHMWGDMSNIMASVRGTENQGVFNIVIGGMQLENPEQLCTSDESVIDFIRNHIGQKADIKIGKIQWVSPYRVNVRMAEKFRCGRVFLTGDAAHVHSPAGAQGMNTSMQDAFNLAWKLALVVKGSSPPSLLDSFNEERLPVVAQMLKISTGLLKKTMENNDESGWDRSGTTKQLGINYRWSSIVVDEEKEILGKSADHGSPYDLGTDAILSAGDRAPDARELATQNDTTLRLFKLFNLAKHTILIFTSKIQTDLKVLIDSLEIYSPELVQAVLIADPGKPIGLDAAAFSLDITIVEDKMDHAHDAYIGAGGESGIFIIRPDGVIGARVKGAEGVIRYFQVIYKSSN